ncbi:MAG: hypothetical protein U5J98_11860 [Halobacteriales archaeon]|nr:hypothetical protein [Halobacteriales archaeon]
MASATPEASPGSTPASRSAADSASPRSSRSSASAIVATRARVCSAAWTVQRSRVAASTAVRDSGRTEVNTRSEPSGWNVRAFPVSETNDGTSASSRNATASGWYCPPYATNAPVGSTTRARRTSSLTGSTSVSTPTTNSRLTRAPVGVTT